MQLPGPSAQDEIRTVAHALAHKINDVLSILYPREATGLGYKLLFISKTKSYQPNGLPPPNIPIPFVVPWFCGVMWAPQALKCQVPPFTRSNFSAHTMPQPASFKDLFFLLIAVNHSIQGSSFLSVYFLHRFAVA